MNLSPCRPVLRPIARFRCLWALALAAGLIFISGHAEAQKRGGILHALVRETPPSFSIHEESTISTVWPASPLFNNLVLYNQAHAVDSAEDLVGELATEWKWSDGGKRLTFKLRRGVTWHDGKPFSGRDVKYTFDLVRGAGEAKLRLSPRKVLYENVKEIATSGDDEVTFVLGRPQPALLSMLASGFAPVYPAHIEPALIRTHPVGTGPFVFKSSTPDQRIELVRNPAYFLRDRPYLDGITYLIIADRTARAAALISNQLDVFFPQEGTINTRDQVVGQVPTMVVHKVAQHASYNIVYNTKKPPFDNLKARQAVNYALDRAAFLETQRGDVIAGGVLVPPPYAPWGLPLAELKKLPGWGDPGRDKAQARKLLQEAGYGPDHPLTIPITARGISMYQDMAVWMAGQLKEVGVVATLDVAETAQFFARVARRDYIIAANVTGTGSGDPDANFYENYSCGSPRNYSDYCNSEMQKLIDEQSQELDKNRRLTLVHEIDRRLQTDVARTLLGQTVDYAMHWPYVKGYVPHHSIFTYGRMQDVWLDR